MNRCIAFALTILFSIQAYGYAKLSKPTINKLEKIDVIKKLQCDDYEGYTYKTTDFSKVEIKESFFKETPIIKGSSTICLLEADTGNSNKPVLNVLERGRIENAPVELFRWGGSGSVGGEYLQPKAWNFACKTDAMSDDVTCYIFHKKLYIYLDKNGYSMTVGNDHYPQTKSFIRINKNKPMESQDSGYFSKEEASAALSELINADKVTIRFTKWPYSEPVDENIDMTYFKAAKAILDRLYENHI